MAAYNADGVFGTWKRSKFKDYWNKKNSNKRFAALIRRIKTMKSNAEGDISSPAEVLANPSPITGVAARWFIHKEND